MGKKNHATLKGQPTAMQIALRNRSEQATQSFVVGDTYSVVWARRSPDGSLRESERGLGKCVSAGNGTVRLIGEIQSEIFWQYNGQTPEKTNYEGEMLYDLGERVNVLDRSHPAFWQVKKLVGK